MVTKEWSSSIADAWGTLTNPVTTYENVLRVKITTVDSTFMYMGGQLISADRYEYIDYEWFSAGNRHPVHSISGEMDGDDFVADGMDYLLVESLGMHDQAEAQLSVYPNPTSDVLHINHTSANMPATYALTDMTGRTVLEINTTTHQQLDVSHLAEGIYMLQELTGNQVISSTKIIIKR